MDTASEGDWQRHTDAPSAGAAYAFAPVDGVWEPKKKVVSKDRAKDHHFGAWLAVSENTVVVASHDKTKCHGCGWPHGDGAAAYVFNSVKDFNTTSFIFAVEPFGLRVTTLGQVKRTALLQNFPNPFNPETWLPYRLADNVPVTLRMYNVQGQLMRGLAYWDGRDQLEETVSSGGLPANGMGLWYTLYEIWRAPIYNEMHQAIFDYYRNTYGGDSPQYAACLPGETGHSNGKYEACVFEKLADEMVQRESNITIVKSHYPTHVERSDRLITTVTFTGMNEDPKNPRRFDIDVPTAKHPVDLYRRTTLRYGSCTRQFGNPHAQPRSSMC